MTLPRADWADCLLRITLDAKRTPKLWEGQLRCRIKRQLTSVGRIGENIIRFGKE